MTTLKGRPSNLSLQQLRDFCWTNWREKYGEDWTTKKHDLMFNTARASRRVAVCRSRKAEGTGAAAEGEDAAATEQTCIEAADDGNPEESEECQSGQHTAEEQARRSDVMGRYVKNTDEATSRQLVSGSRGQFVATDVVKTEDHCSQHRDQLAFMRTVTSEIAFTSELNLLKEKWRKQRPMRVASSSSNNNDSSSSNNCTTRNSNPTSNSVTFEARPSKNFREFEHLLHVFALPEQQFDKCKSSMYGNTAFKFDVTLLMRSIDVDKPLRLYKYCTRIYHKSWCFEVNKCFLLTSCARDNEIPIWQAEDGDDELRNVLLRYWAAKDSYHHVTLDVIVCPEMFSGNRDAVTLDYNEKKQVRLYDPWRKPADPEPAGPGSEGLAAASKSNTTDWNSPIFREDQLSQHHHKEKPAAPPEESLAKVKPRPAPTSSSTLPSIPAVEARAKSPTEVTRPTPKQTRHPAKSVPQRSSQSIPKAAANVSVMTLCQSNPLTPATDASTEPLPKVTRCSPTSDQAGEAPFQVSHDDIERAESRSKAEDAARRLQTDKGRWQVGW